MTDYYGIKSSVEGQDVFSLALDSGNVNSKYSHPKVQLNQTPAHFAYQQYTFASEPGVGTITLLTVAHGYSYAPMHWTMMDRRTNDYYFFAPIYITADVGFPIPGIAVDTYYAYTDDTNLYVKFRRETESAGDYAEDVNGVTVSIKYMIFAEDGT